MVTENGCDVNISNEDKESLLMFTMANSRAPGEKKAELIRALLQRGADVNARNSKGQTTFMYACIMNQVKPLKVLLDQVNMNQIKPLKVLLDQVNMNQIKPLKVLIDQVNMNQIKPLKVLID